MLEKIVNERLKYYIESNAYVTKYQSGFRRGRSTMDRVPCLEYDIKNAQIKEYRIVAAFVDIKKAYDMMWKEKNW